ELLTISKGRLAAAILLTDQRDGSETIDGLSGTTIGEPFTGFGREPRVWVRRWDRAVGDGVDRQVYFPHDAGVVCACLGQPHRRDLDYAGVARHRSDDEPGPDHRHLPRHY